MPEKTPYYLAAQVRELDRLAIEEHGIPGFTLMQRAGQAAFETLQENWPQVKHVMCFCGSGNNGGDGYVIAALARRQGLDTTAVTVGNTDKLSGDAMQALKLAINCKVPVIPFHTLSAAPVGKRHQTGTVIVDAMLGTGLTGAVRGDYATAITLINTLPFPVLAADIPSGLCSDTGKVLGTAINADVTVTFIGRKLGQVIAQGPAHCGRLVFADLGVPSDIYTRLTPVYR